MKKSFLFKLFGAATASLLFTNACLAQAPGMAGGMEAVMAKLFGDNKFFTSDAEISMSDPTGKQSMTIPVGMSQLDGKIRSETDLEKAKGGAFPPQVMQQMKDMGMSKMINITRPDTKNIIMIYPNLTSYVQMPMPKEQADALSKTPKMDKTEIGKETVDGHSCVKSKIVITDDAGKTQDFFVWNATDLKNFPVKMQITNPRGGDIIISYKNIKFEKPDAKLFEAPASYTKYNSQMEIMQAAMAKSGGPKP